MKKGAIKEPPLPPLALKWGFLIGIPPVCHNTGINMCNPILQAKYMNEQKTDLNILIGLCVGHDSLFYRYSDAFVTTLVSKDRVMAHNTVGALYQADKYLHLI